MNQQIPEVDAFDGHMGKKSGQRESRKELEISTAFLIP